MIVVWDEATQAWTEGAVTPPVGAAPVVTTTGLGALTQDAPFTLMLAATGSTPIVWAVTAGALPAGLVLSSAGVLSGTPTAAGLFSFTVTASNAFGSGTKVFAGSVTGTDGTAEWQALFTARDIPGLEAWYQAYTGHRAAPTRTVPNTLVNSSWLSSNLGNGVTQEGGRWVVSRVRFDGGCRVAANNITFRDVIVESNGGYHGIHSPVGETPTGIIIEHSTLMGEGADWLGVQFPEAVASDTIIVRRCNISGYRVGIQIIGGMNAVENYVHDLYYDAVDPHVTSMSIRARNVNVLRNWMGDGNSAALAFYNESSPYTNILAEGNIFTTSKAIWEVAYLGSYPPGSNTVRLVGNLFERGALAYGAGNFTEVSGNKTFAGATVN